MMRITTTTCLMALLLSIMGCETKIDERTEDFGNYILQYTDSIALSRHTTADISEYIKGYQEDSILFKTWIADLKEDSIRRMKFIYKKAAIIHSLDSLYGRPLSNEEAIKYLSLLKKRYEMEWPTGAKYIMAWRYVENYADTKYYLYNWQVVKKQIENQ